jgi:hypothetical protein
MTLDQQGTTWVGKGHCVLPAGAAKTENHCKLLDNEQALLPDWVACIVFSMMPCFPARSAHDAVLSCKVCRLRWRHYKAAVPRRCGWGAPCLIAHAPLAHKHV